ncbi:MAG: HAMP domain-containing protein [Gammaproteobacteria bacterium]|nr:HAMP domain-containing protein [Gammaproteobacteria bacterium]
MSFRSQILLAPLLMVLILIILVSFMRSYHTELTTKNSEIRHWAKLTDSLHIAIGAGERMLRLINQQQSIAIEEDEFVFNYSDQFMMYSDAIDCQACRPYLSNDLINQINASVATLNMSDKWNAAHAAATLDKLLPRLEHQYNLLLAQKRDTYMTYYDELNQTGDQLIFWSLVSIFACIVVGVGLALYFSTRISRRISVLAEHARSITQGDLHVTPRSEKPQDELDQLTNYLSDMTQKLINVVAVDKLMQGAEEERRRLAMELHDGALADLAALRRKLDDMYTKDVDQCITNIRDIIEDIHPQTLSHLGLQASLNAYMNRHLDQNKQLYHLSVPDHLEEHLGPDKLIHVYRIITEAIINTVKHASAKRLEVSALSSESGVRFIVEDDGNGLQESATGGFGISNMLERAKLIGAQLSFRQSRFSSGTCLELEVRYA